MTNFSLVFFWHHRCNLDVKVEIQFVSSACDLAKSQRSPSDGA